MLFKRKRKKNKQNEQTYFTIAFLPDMVDEIDFYTDGKGIIYIAKKDCDFASKDEFIKMGLLKVECNELYPSHIKNSPAILNTPFYRLFPNQFDVIEIQKEYMEG